MADSTPTEQPPAQSTIESGSADQPLAQNATLSEPTDEDAAIAFPELYTKLAEWTEPNLCAEPENLDPEDRSFQRAWLVYIPEEFRLKHFRTVLLDGETHLVNFPYAVTLNFRIAGGIYHRRQLRDSGWKMKGMWLPTEMPGPTEGGRRRVAGYVQIVEHYYRDHNIFEKMGGYWTLWRNGRRWHPVDMTMNLLRWLNADDDRLPTGPAFDLVRVVHQHCINNKIFMSPLLDDNGFPSNTKLFQAKANAWAPWAEFTNDIFSKTPQSVPP